MKLKLIIEGSPLEQNLYQDPLAFVVEQANGKAIVNQTLFFQLKGKVVKALVPAHIPTVTHQTSNDSITQLAKCYSLCLKAAIDNGAKSIIVKPLGVGVKLTKMLDNGDVVSSGLWGNLFWTHSNSSLAAKQAIGELVNLSKEFNVFFVVPEDYISEWDWVD